MARCILTVVVLTFFMLTNSFSGTFATNNQLSAGESPFKNNLGYTFFDINSQMSSELRNNTILKQKSYSDNQCESDINAIKEGIRKYEEWALQYPDSWGSFPFGLLWGHTISMGQFEECIAATHKVSSTHTIQGQYCLASVPIKNFYSAINRNNKLARANYYMRKDPSIVEIGVCVPNSCSPAKTDEVLKAILKKYLKQEIESNMITEKFCKTNEPIKLRAIDIFAIVFFSFIVFCILASSIYDYIQTKNNQPKKPLFSAFSVLTNAPKIFTVKRVDNPNVIHCLNGMRCFSMMWVVFGHGWMTFYSLPHINKDEAYYWFETPYSMLVQNSTLCVDTFFFMSGLLMLWGAFREMEKTKGHLNIKMMYFHRYIRLTPVVAVVILYTMSLYKYSGAGPMWMKLATQDKRCEHTWWATLLYVQNYVYPANMCVGPSWYLAVDTQLYILSPLFLIPLWKWGKKALPPIIIFLILCLGCTFATYIFNGFTLFRIKDNDINLRQKLTYYPTHTRIPTWLIGVIFGYFLFTKNRGRKIPMKKCWVITGWVLALGVMVTDLWGPYWRIRPETPNPPIYEGAIYESLSRTSWALAIGWIVWACYNGHGGVINDFLSWGLFTGFSRLTYCMYCTHRIIQSVNASRLQTDTHFSNYDNILRWWSDFGLSLTVSIFATLAFEAPILGIEKAIFGRDNTKSNSEKHKTPATSTAVIVAENNPSKA